MKESEIYTLHDGPLVGRQFSVPRSWRGQDSYQFFMPPRVLNVARMAKVSAVVDSDGSAPILVRSQSVYALYDLYRSVEFSDTEEARFIYIYRGHFFDRQIASDAFDLSETQLLTIPDRSKPE